MVMRVVIAGHVDHGKSTLLGRLLNDTNQIFPEKKEKIKKDCEQKGKKFEYAYFLDAFEEEQSQGITIDKTELSWNYSGQNFTFIDTPGHREFLKNMISGATIANAALVMVDASSGVKEQFIRHSYIINMLGIKSIIIVINKMDLINYSESKFFELSKNISEIYATYKIQSYSIIPVSAYNGENVIEKSKNLEWFKGPTLAKALVEINKKNNEITNRVLRLSIQDTYKFDEKRIYVAKIQSGTLYVGDRINFLPNGSSSKIKTIESWNESNVKSAKEDDSVGFTLEDSLYLERGEVGFKELTQSPQITFQIHASVFWLGSKPLEKNKSYKFKMLTQEVDCKIESIFNVFDPNIDTLNKSEAPSVKNGEAAEVIIKFSKKIVCDQFSFIEQMGRFVILDNDQVSGGGIVLNPNSIQTKIEMSHLKYEDRVEKQGHEGCVLWLTGLPSSGKSTIAKTLEYNLFHKNINIQVIDGDNLRNGLNVDLGFSAEDRKENIRRAAEVASLLAQNGSLAIVALISPALQDREMARSICKNTKFYEIYIECPLSECEKRDPKGMYKKARNGEIRNFTGVDAIYEVPTSPDLKIDTLKLSLDMAKQALLTFLIEKKVLLKQV